MKRIGTQRRLKDGEREKLLQDLTFWHTTNINGKLIATRDEYENAFNCIWAGANAKGVRLNGVEAAFPFEGASDQRIRWGQRIYKEHLALIIIAISSARVEITCGGDAAGQERARSLMLLLDSLMNSLGAKGMGEIRTMLRYMLVDTPAVAGLSVDWMKRTSLGVEQLNVEDLKAEYAAMRVATGEIAPANAEEEFLNFLGEYEPNGALRAWLMSAKKIDEEFVDDVIAALWEDGACEVCVQSDVQEGPELTALRYMNDFCVPRVTPDFDYASPWFKSEWVTAAQLRERVEAEDWDADWVERTIEACEAKQFYFEQASQADEDYKGLYNLVWCYFAETNERGETTRFVCVLSQVEGSAFGKRVIRTRRGKWNTVLFRREEGLGNVTDGRGIAELCAPDQGVAKILRDGAANNSIMGSNPPVKAKGARVRNIVIEPFAVLPMNANDDVTFMQPPAYPAAAIEAEKKIFEDLLALVGVSNGQTDVSARQREFMEWIIVQWRDFLILLLEVAQDSASDEYILRATETKDLKGVRAADVSGPFLIKLKFDPTNIDYNVLIKKITAVGQVIQNDRKGLVDTSAICRHALTMIFPDLAGSSFKSDDQMVADDIEDEKKNFVLIKSGVLPKINANGGWNYAARLDWWSQIQQDEAAMEGFPQGAYELMTRWIQALQQQQTQFGENAQIGKTGVEGIMAQ